MKRQTFEFDGAGYARASSHQKAWGATLMEGLALRGDEKILDLGCGDGRGTLQLAQLVPQGSVLGIDSSAGMIAEAEKQAAANCTFAQMDMMDLPYEAEFDIIFSNAALHWVRDQEALARRIYRALRPGGIFAAGFAGKGSSPAMIGSLRTVMAEGPYKDSFQDFAWPWKMPAEEEFARDLRSAGFADPQVHIKEIEQDFDERGLCAWVDQPCIVPFLPALPQDLREPFRDEVTERITASARQPDGSFRELFRRLEVLAQKPEA